MIGPTALIDTNVLVYIYDDDEPLKAQAAGHLVASLHRHGIGAVSAQVLGEFFVTATRRFHPKMTSAKVASHTRLWGDVFPVFDTTAEVVAEALRGVETYRFSYYDAQIWAIARLNRIPFVFTEDFNGGCTIEGVQFVNPFVGEFDLGPVLAE
ncbi:MAG: PIN domain-containing protein [Coriobacteriia bacterium]